MDIGDSKMVEMCVKWDPVCPMFWEKNQVQWIPFDPNMTQTCNSKMIKWPEVETEVELSF